MKLGPAGTIRSVERENRLRRHTAAGTFPTSQNDKPAAKSAPKTERPSLLSGANKMRDMTDKAAAAIKGNRAKTRCGE